jgi:hypothetical protein
MRDALKPLLGEVLRVARALDAKAMPSALAGQQWSGTQYVDAYKRNRQPSPNELMAELKNTAWACASINAAVCASNPPSLFVATSPGQAEPKCLSKALTKRQEHELRSNRRLPVKWRKAVHLREVLDHPLLTLLNQVNPTASARSTNSAS